MNLLFVVSCLAFASVAYGTRCQCGPLKQCLEEMHQKHRTTETTKCQECHEQCQSNLGQYADAMKTCHDRKVQDKQTMHEHMDQHKAEVMACIFRESDACDAEAARFKRAARYPRDHHEHREHKAELINRMKEAFPPEFEAALNCYDECMGTLSPLKIMRHGKGGMVAKAFGKCAQKLGCEVDEDAAKAAYYECRPERPAGVSSFSEHCSCAANAFGVMDFDCSMH